MPKPITTPDPEVTEKTQRRRFTAESKALARKLIAETCTKQGIQPASSRSTPTVARR